MAEDTSTTLDSFYAEELDKANGCRCAFSRLDEATQQWLKDRVSEPQATGGKVRWKALTVTLRKAGLSTMTPETLRQHFDRHGT